MGAWLRVNGASIHGTSQGPLAKLPFEGRCTQKGNRVFLQVFEWPEGGLPLPPELAAASSARTLDGGRKLGITRKAEGVTIEKPRKLDRTRRLRAADSFRPAIVARALSGISCAVLAVAAGRRAADACAGDRRGRRARA